MNKIVIINKIPQFKRGNILDKEVLQNLQTTPYEMYELMYNNYSDGIITGIELSAEENNIVAINSGVIKFNDFYYRINKNIKINIPINDGDYIIKIKFSGHELNDKYLEYKSEIYIDENKNLEKNEMELCRIRRREGAEIRNTDSFLKIDKEYNIISEIEKPKSSNSGILLSEQLLKLFVKKINENKEIKDIDDIFSFSVLNSNITREALDLYIYRKLKIDSTEKSNKELYQYLSQIYLEMNDDRKIKNNRIMTKNKIIVE